MTLIRKIKVDAINPYNFMKVYFELPADGRFKK
jgi:hypothetical protein